MTAEVGGGAHRTGSESSVSWPCFTRSAAAAGFGRSGCAAARVDASRVRPLASAPSAPFNLAASVTGSTVTLTWTAPAGSDPPSAYIVDAGSVAGASDVASFNSGNASTMLVVQGVPAATYFVRIRATNGAGTSGPSNEVRITVGNAVPCGALSPPTSLAAAVTGSTVMLTWAAPGGCAPTGYIIQAGSASGASNLANFAIGSAATAFTAGGVQSGTYFVRVLSSAGGVSSAPSAEVVVTVGGCAAAPDAPANLTAAVTGSAVRLAWTAPSGACAATSYVVLGGSTPGSGSISSVTTDTTLTFTGLAPGTYYFRVRGANTAGQSGASNEVVVTIAAPAPAAGATIVRGAAGLTTTAYAPNPINITVGTTVTWTNNDSLTHTVTGGGFDAGNLAPGAGGSVTFSSPGSFAYHCAIHPNMVGTVNVQ